VDTGSIGLRERTRNAVRAQLADAAVRLFVRQGFEATTVEQIATETGLSRRSFHRYFASKEDVLGQWFAEMGEQLASALAGRTPAEPPWFALRRAFDGLIDGLSARPESLAITRMMVKSPALHGSHLQKQAHWRVVLADALQPRLAERGNDAARMAAIALAGAALASLDSAQTEWISETNTRSLAQLVDDAMNAIAPLEQHSRNTDGTAGTTATFA